MAAADDAMSGMPPQGLPLASEQAGGESRRTDRAQTNVAEITRSDAKEVALLTTHTSSACYAAWNQNSATYISNYLKHLTCIENYKSKTT